jgi:transcriptional regulator of acetoin/glycerol metabolism
MVDAAISAIIGYPGGVVRSWSPEYSDAATEAADETVIVRDVMKLDAGRQQQLYQWLDERGAHARVIATTSEPLYPMVEARQFLEPLYYRLNIVCVDCCRLERAGRLS